MKILVTGGAGFIGSNFVRRALTEKYTDIEKVIVLDKLTYAGNLSNLSDVKNDRKLEFIKGDICDQRLVTSLVSKVDSVINFAAETHVDRSIGASESFLLTNVNGVRVLLDSILHSDRKIRFLQVSTDEVYGSINSGSWDEDCPLMPNSPYAASKASADLFVRAYIKTHQIDAIITRCSNNYGPYQHPEKLIPLFISNLLENKPVPVYGDGQNVRDWLHVNDHCDGILLALTKGRSGEIYNIGGGLELTNIEITKIILELLKKDESSIEYVLDRKGHDKRYSINCKKINDELSYVPRVTFEDGIKETVKWYTKNQSWWKILKLK